MSRRYHRIGITVFLAAVFSFCISRDIQIEKQYTLDLRNRIVGARLQKDGRLPYFFKWQPSDGMRYYDPANIDPADIDNTYGNAITASPFFHHLLYPIADLPQRKISQIWLAFEYIIFISIVLIAFTFTKNLSQQWTVAIGSALFLFMHAWMVHVLAGQMYITIPFFAIVFLFCFLRKDRLFFSFISGLAAATMILIRPTCVIFFIPFLLLLNTFKIKEAFLFFLPIIVLFGYSLINSKERSYWLEYREAIAAHIKLHQSNEHAPPTFSFKTLNDTSMEGWNVLSVYKLRNEFPFVLRSETSSIGVFSRDALHINIPAWVINFISFGSIASLMFVFWRKETRNKDLSIIIVAIFGFCLYMVSDFLSPLFRIQYYGVQWAFPLLLLAAFYDRRLRTVYLLLLAGLLLNITNTPYLKMRHTIGELIILFTLLWLCLSPKSQLIK